MGLKVNVIIDNRRMEDYGRLLEVFIEQGITRYKFWESENDKKTVIGNINAAHKRIVRYALENELDRIAILEQDVYFPAKDGWKYFLNNMPEKFSIYSAATYVDDFHNKNILCGFHCYVVDKSYYEKFLSVDDNLHIDTAIDEMGGDFKVCRPFAALQLAGWSFNHSINVDYNSVLKDEDIYK